jgi:hypothetical protein
MGPNLYARVCFELHEACDLRVVSSHRSRHVHIRLVRGVGSLPLCVCGRLAPQVSLLVVGSLEQSLAALLQKVLDAVFSVRKPFLQAATTCHALGRIAPD